MDTFIPTMARIVHSYFFKIKPTFRIFRHFPLQIEQDKLLYRLHKSGYLDKQATKLSVPLTPLM